MGSGHDGRPRGLDICCGAGGASRGYDLAGFDMTGVDHHPQPNYPYRFIQADALDVLASPFFLAQFALIHVSPICQGWTPVTDWRGSRQSHTDLLTPVLAALPAVGQPWIVENAPEACPPLRADYLLCGTNFGLNVRRHRAFQLGNWSDFDLLPACQCRRNPRLLPFGHKNERAFADAMGCTWMTKLEARQAVPPAYTEFLGSKLIAKLSDQRVCETPETV